MPRQHEPARAGFVDDVQAAPNADLAAQRLRDSVAAARHCCGVTHFGAARRFACADIDAVLVDVQPDKQSVRFAHGSSP